MVLRCSSAIDPSSPSQPLDRYELKLGGDEYARNVSKFKGATFPIRDNPDARDTNIGIASVDEHVKMLENALRRVANGQEPFDNEWESAHQKYTRDCLTRIEGTVYFEVAIGILRSAAVDVAAAEALQGLIAYIQSRASFDQDGQFTPGHGWVLYLLETYLGDALRQIDESLPNDGEVYQGNNPETPANVRLSESILIDAVSKAMATIEYITLSRKPTERFQVFESRGGSVVDSTQWDLGSGQATTSVRRAMATDIKLRRDELYAYLAQGEDHPSTHEVILEVRGVPWQAVRKGLGAGYVTWGIIDTTSDRNLLGFSSLRR